MRRGSLNSLSTLLGPHNDTTTRKVDLPLLSISRLYKDKIVIVIRGGGGNKRKLNYPILIGLLLHSKQDAETGLFRKV